MPVLTTKQRKRLRPQSFALEKERKYPIHDLSHARNALARVAQHGTRAEIKEVKREVYAKYLSLRPTNPEVTKSLPTTLEEYKADPYWREQQAEYLKRIKPFSEKADKEIKKVNDAFMAGKTSLAKNQAQRDAINLELDKQANKIRKEMGIPKTPISMAKPKVSDIIMGEVILYGGLPMTRANVHRQALKDTGSRKAADMFTFGSHIKLAPKGWEPLTLAQFRKVTKLPSRGRVRITPKRPRIS